MSGSSIVDRLASLPPLAGIPREQLQWAVDHGTVHHAEDGATFYGDGSGLVGLFILVSGRFSVRVERNGVVREMREVMPGRITGYLPYSRLKTARGYLVADGPVEFVVVPEERMRDMTRACYELTAMCVHEMLDRVRDFKDDDKHLEKMAALGRLSAGLAHELNNPVSAVTRAAGGLDTTRKELVAAAEALGRAGLDEDGRRALRDLESVVGRQNGHTLSSVQRADLEDQLMDWLERRGADADLAHALAGAGVTPAELEPVASSLDGARLAAVLRYVAATTAARTLAEDISSATQRIHSLVEAVKKHTHMDRAHAREPVSIGDHLADTLTLMRSKAALKGARVDLSVEPGLPCVEGSVVDLNQVWMHLIDNAVDAVGESGSISVEAVLDQGLVVVRVVDDGPGIPPENQERVFEPFFTTKEVGQGRGLGLDVVRTVVLSHKGTVDVTSRPGRTELRVTLPASEAER